MGIVDRLLIVNGFVDKIVLQTTTIGDGHAPTKEDRVEQVRHTLRHAVHEIHALFGKLD